MKREEEPHQLMAKNIGCIVDWKEWRKLWQEESRADFLHSLLHFGFEVKTYDEKEVIDRVCMYLDLANGAFDYRTFRSYPNDRFMGYNRFDKEITTYQDLRYIISQKAFQMLCQHLFKNTSEDDKPSWIWPVVLPQVFSKLSWFFRVDNEYQDIYNLSDVTGHNAKIAKDFAREFCFFAWKCDEFPLADRLSDEIRETFRKARPSMIEIMFGLKELPFLLEEERYRTFDEECEKKLEEMALSHELYLFPHAVVKHKPGTIEEACFAGSQAAQVLILLRKIQEQGALYDKLAELEEQRHDAEEQIKKLK